MRTFNDYRVEYLIIGGYAVIKYTESRYTKDIDICDILMSISGITFDKAWENRVNTDFGEVSPYVISKDDLVKAKKASGRPQDLIDARLLEITSKGE